MPKIWFKRVSVDQLCEHLKKIALNEKGKITDDAVKLIARLSEGSVKFRFLYLIGFNIQTAVQDKDIKEKDVKKCGPCW